MLEAHVTIDLSGLKEFERSLDDQLNHRMAGPITTAFRQWGERYRSFIKERFDTYSKGGGDWPPLAESTMRARRGPSGSGSKKDARAKAGRLRKRINRAKKALAKLNSQPAKRGRTIKTANRKKKLQASIVKANASFKKNKSLKGRKFSILRDTGTLFAALSPTFAGKPGQMEDGIQYGIRVGYGGNHKHPKANASVADIAHWHQTGAGHLPVRTIIVSPTDKLMSQMAGDMQRAVDKLAAYF